MIGRFFGVKAQGSWTYYLVEDENSNLCKNYVTVLRYVDWLLDQEWVEDFWYFECQDIKEDYIDLIESFGKGSWNNEIENVHVELRNNKNLKWSGRYFENKFILWKLGRG